MEKPRRTFSPSEKVAILREHLLDKGEVSAVCEKHGLNPTQFYRWQQEFFENGATAFEHQQNGQERRFKERIEYLEGKLAKKDEVIAEIMASHVALKKSLGEV